MRKVKLWDLKISLIGRLSLPMKTFPFLSLLLFTLNLGWSETDRTRPNFILIMVDDMGYSDIGCYGGEVQTPTCLAGVGPPRRDGGRGPGGSGGIGPQ